MPASSNRPQGQGAGKGPQRASQQRAQGSSKLLSTIIFMAIVLFVVYQLMTCSASQATYYGDEAFYPTW